MTMKKSVLIASAAAVVATIVATSAIVAAGDASIADADHHAAENTGHATGQNNAGHDNAQGLVARGEYLIKIAGCHDCHTPGYTANAGKVADKSLWLVGDTVGWQGAWGTTYPANLRLYFDRMTEAQWLQVSATFQTRPPMPWFNLHDMTEIDRKAIYHYVRELGPAGEMAPAYVPPGEKAAGKLVVFQ
jgi:mono/diheme cytochrome c family protein